MSQSPIPPPDNLTTELDFIWLKLSLLDIPSIKRRNNIGFRVSHLLETKQQSFPICWYWGYKLYCKNSRWAKLQIKSNIDILKHSPRTPKFLPPLFQSHPHQVYDNGLCRKIWSTSFIQSVSLYKELYLLLASHNSKITIESEIRRDDGIFCCISWLQKHSNLHFA